MDVDVEFLITLVEDRPILWDKTLEKYKDRNLTRSAWEEVCIELNSEFVQLGDIEKNAFGKEVIKRWTNLRDSFVKSLKKEKEVRSSRSAAKKQRTYLYHDQLIFLKKLYAERQTCNSLSEGDSCHEVENDSVDNILVGKPLVTEEINLDVSKKPAATRKQKRIDEVELKILKALEPKIPDPNMSFFQSLLPHLKNFNEEEILQFQMGVLKVISNLHERKKGTVYSPQYSQQTNYYHPSHLAHPSFSQLSPFHNQPQQSLIPTPTNQMSQQYHQYNQAPHFKQFSQSPAVPSEIQPFTSGTPSRNSPLANHSSLSYTCSKTPLLSENDNSSNFGQETECLKTAVNEDLFRSEAINSAASSPESIASSTYSVDFNIH